MATEKDPPLYLHVSALLQEELDAAVEKINEVINSEAQESFAPQREAFQPQSRSMGGPSVSCCHFILLDFERAIISILKNHIADAHTGSHIALFFLEG